MLTGPAGPVMDSLVIRISLSPRTITGCPHVAAASPGNGVGLSFVHDQATFETPAHGKLLTPVAFCLGFAPDSPNAATNMPTPKAEASVLYPNPTSLHDSIKSRS